MRQQINLYTGLIEKDSSKTPLTWVRMWIIVSIVSVFFLSESTFTLINSYFLSQKVQKAELEVKQTKTEFEQFKKKFPKIFFSKDVTKSINELDVALKKQEQILNQLASKTKFSEYLTTLAQTATKDVWFTKIVINVKQASVSLYGTTRSITALKKLMGALSKEIIFANKNLEIKEIDADETQTAGADINFHIAMVNRHV